MERPEYVCGPPASRQISSVTKYLNPAADTLWCASSTRGFAFNLGSPITLLMRSSTTGAMLYTPPSRQQKINEHHLLLSGFFTFCLFPPPTGLRDVGDDRRHRPLYIPIVPNN